MTARRWATASLNVIVLLLAACNPSKQASSPLSATATDEPYQRPANAPPCQQYQLGKSYALVIGVGDYDYVGKLDAPNSDARRVYDFLTNEACFDRVVLLTEENGSRDRIAQLMDKDFPDLVKTNDRFFFYFSGHGDTRTLGTGSKRGYLLLKKSHKETWNEMIDMQQVHEWAENFGAARHVLFVLDACFSGLAAFQPKAVSSTLPATLERLSRPSSYLMTAGVEQEESFVFNGSSLFTQAFLAAARGQVDPPADGILSLDGLIDRINISLDAKRQDIGSKIKMTPQLYRERFENNEGQFFFLLPNSSQRTGEPVAALSALAGKNVVPVIPGPVPQDPRGASTAVPSPNKLRLAAVSPGLKEFQDCKEMYCPVMVSVGPGSLQMGSTDNSDEGPLHPVNIAYSFAVGKFPITRAQWRQYLTDSGRRGSTDCNGINRSKRMIEIGHQYNWLKPGFYQEDGHPVVCVKWQEAVDYAAWLSQKTGHLYRLLSEAEYEYIERAGRTEAYPWDKTSDEQCAHVNAGDATLKAELRNAHRAYSTCSDGFVFTSPVDRFPANAFGLYDTDGNVYSWTQDCYHENYRGAPADGSAWKNRDCLRHVVRGGSYSSDPQQLRSTFRFWLNGVDSYAAIGFRLARTN